MVQKWIPRHGTLCATSGFYDKWSANQFILFGKPFFFNLFNGHCYTMQLNQTNKIISVIIRINTGIKIFPQSANKIQTLANPSWYEALHRNYR